MNGGPDMPGIDIGTIGFITPSPNPLQPQDISPALQQAPPCCPNDACVNVFLYPLTKNPAGDLLLECLNDGYQTVYRVASGQFEPRPGVPSDGWRPPKLHIEAATATPDAGPKPEPARAPRPRRTPVTIDSSTPSPEPPPKVPAPAKRVTIPKAAEMLGIDKAGVLGLIASGELPALPKGVYRVDPVDIEAYRAKAARG